MIEIWCELHDGQVYVLPGGGDRADWVRNLRRTPLARELVLDGKYQGWREGASLELGEECAPGRDRPFLAHRTSGQ